MTQITDFINSQWEGYMKCTCPVEMLKMTEKFDPLPKPKCVHLTRAGQSWNVLLVLMLNLTTISQATWILH